eukprot:6096481-Ditylum_brightwellii.AAC.1
MAVRERKASSSRDARLVKLFYGGMIALLMNTCIEQDKMVSTALSLPGNHPSLPKGGFKCGQEGQGRGGRFLTVEGVSSIKKGNKLFIAATMEPVGLERLENGWVLCSFPPAKSNMSSNTGGSSWTEKCAEENQMGSAGSTDVTAPICEHDAKRWRINEGQKSAQKNDDDHVLINRNAWIHNKLVLLCRGDEACTCNMWKNAQKQRKAEAKIHDNGDAAAALGIVEMEEEE